MGVTPDGLIFWHNREPLGLKSVQQCIANYTSRTDRHLEKLKEMVDGGEDAEKIEKFKITVDNNAITLDYWKNAEKVMKEKQGI